MTTQHQNITQLFNKVPEVTFFFWLIKIMATTVGETAADFLAFNLHVGLSNTSLIMGGLLFAFLFIQLRAKKYVPWLYWMTVVFISIFGTLVTDNLVDNFGVTLESTTLMFSVALIATFMTWYAKEKTLSIHTIYTTRRELFYWLAILCTFALGTAAGDLVAESLALGYAVSALIFGILILVIAIGHYFLRGHAVIAFWLAYILTRPFGASCGDYLSQPIVNGGLGLGTVKVSFLFLIAILSLVIYLTRQQKSAT